MPSLDTTDTTLALTTIDEASIQVNATRAGSDLERSGYVGTRPPIITIYRSRASAGLRA